MKPELVNIFNVINKWILAAMTGNLSISIDFNQGGIRNIEVNEKTKLKS